MGWIIAIIVVLIVGFLFVRAYNNLIKRRNRVDTAWGHVDVQLRRRSDLIPNLVATVKGYAAHEKEIFERVTQLRSQCMAKAGPVNKQADESQLVDFFDYQSRIAAGEIATDSTGGPGRSGRRVVAFAGLAVAILVIGAVFTVAVQRAKERAADESVGEPPESIAAAPSQVAGSPAGVESEVPTDAPPKVPPVTRAPAENTAKPAAEARTPSPGAARPAEVTNEEPAERRPAEVVAAPQEPPTQTQKPKPTPSEPKPEAAATPVVATAVLKFQEPSWVEIWRDGDPNPYFGLEEKGKELTLPLDGSLKIHLGNAGGVSLSVDGRPGKPLGGDGEARTFRIDSRNWRSFLQ